MKHLAILGMLVVLAGCITTAGDVPCNRHLERINPVVGATIAPTAAKDVTSKSPTGKASIP